MVQRWQYQIRAETLPFAAPDFGWFVQASEPVRVQPQHPEQAVAQPVAEHESIIPSHAWFVQETDVFRAPHQVRPGASVLGQPPIIPAFDWYVAPPDVIRPLHQTRPGYFVSGQVEGLIIVDLDWFVQEPDQVFRAPHQTRSGLSVLGQPPIIPAYDWFHQQADVVRPSHQVRPGWFSLVEFGIPILPEVIDLDWFVQGPDVRAALHQVRQGLFVLGEPPTIPAFDWLIAQPDILRPLHQVQPGLVAFQFAPVPVALPDFGWFVQGSDVILPVHQVRPGLFVIGEPTAIPDLSWYNQHPELYLPAKFRPYYYPTQEFRTELPPVVLLTQWFQAQENPTIRPLGVLGISILPLLEVAAPPLVGPVFLLRVCLALWEFEINRLLPDPSGFVTIEVDVTPSGWIPTGRNVPWEM